MIIRKTFTDVTGGEVDITTGHAAVNVPVVRVHVDDRESNHTALLQHAPEQARELAAALLRAADEAESGVSEEACLRTELAAIDVVKRSR